MPKAPPLGPRLGYAEDNSGDLPRPCQAQSTNAHSQGRELTLQGSKQLVVQCVPLAKSSQECSPDSAGWFCLPDKSLDISEKKEPQLRKCPGAEGAQGSHTSYPQRLGAVSHITPNTEDWAWNPTSSQLQAFSSVPYITPASGDQQVSPHCPNCRKSGTVPHIQRSGTRCSTALQGSLFQVHSTYLMSPEKLPLYPEGLTS